MVSQVRSNVAISTDATFHRVMTSEWSRADLPIRLQWRSSLWRYMVPSLWVIGWALWIWVVSLGASFGGLVVQGLFFVGVPLILALTAGWWVKQLATRRTAATIMLNEDYLEWQYAADSEVDLLADCGPFELAAKPAYDARIEWDLTTDKDEGAGGWPRWTRHWRLLDSIKSDRVLYARDLGLDRGDLESLCKLLNQLREEALAKR